jgi:hypothetical protein
VNAKIRSLAIHQTGRRAFIVYLTGNELNVERFKVSEPFATFRRVSSIMHTHEFEAVTERGVRRERLCSVGA